VNALKFVAAIVRNRTSGVVVREAMK